MSAANKTTIWNRTFFCILFANCCLSLSQQIVNPLITTYGRWLGAGTTLIGFMTGMYYGVSFLMRPVSGPAITVLNRKVLLVVAYGLGAVVNLMYAIFPYLGMFIFSRFLHGVEFSIIGSLLLTIASDSLPANKVGSGLGIFGLGQSVATAIGPAIGLALREAGNQMWGAENAGGFKLSFLVAAAICTVALIPCILSKPKPIDKEAVRTIGPWYKNILAITAVPPALVNCFLSMAHILYTAYLVPYGDENGLGNVAIFFTIYAVVMLVGRPLCGKLTDRYGSVSIALPGLVCYGCSFLFVSFLRSMTGIYIAAVFAAIGYSSVQPAIQALCLQSVPPVKRGVASNTNYLGLDLGLFLGPTFGGIAVSLLEGSATPYSSMYLIGILPIAVAVVLLLVFRKYMVRNLEANRPKA